VADAQPAPLATQTGRWRAIASLDPEMLAAMHQNLELLAKQQPATVADLGLMETRLDKKLDEKLSAVTKSFGEKVDVLGDDINGKLREHGAKLGEHGAKLANIQLECVRHHGNVKPVPVRGALG
jgi:hypothetical protein